MARTNDRQKFSNLDIYYFSDSLLKKNWNICKRIREFIIVDFIRWRHKWNSRMIVKILLNIDILQKRISFINLLNKHIDFILQDGVTEEDR